MSGNTNVKTKRFYDSIDLFRGFTIWLIVMGHIMFFFTMPGGVDGYASSHWIFLYRYLSVFAFGSSAYFVFISGFLFYTVFYQRGLTQITYDSYLGFVKGKIKKVFLPYLIVVTVFICFRLYQDPAQFSSSFLQYGGFWYWSFWYIPFIMVVFLLTPIYVKFIQLSVRWRLVVFIVSVFLSLIVGRHDSNPVLSALFWNSMYMFGIWVGMNYKAIVGLDLGWKASIVLVSFVFATVFCAIPGAFAMHAGRTWDINFNYIHAQILMKMALCIVYLFIFEWLSRGGKYYHRRFKSFG